MHSRVYVWTSGYIQNLPYKVPMKISNLTIVLNWKQYLTQNNKKGLIYQFIFLILIFIHVFIINWTKNSTLLLWDTSGWIVFVHFLEEFEDIKKTFRNKVTFRNDQLCLDFRFELNFPQTYGKTMMVILIILEAKPFLSNFNFKKPFIFY